MIKKTALLVFSAILVFFAISCKDSITDNPYGNKAPTTKVFLDSAYAVSKQKSKIDIHWIGDDPDGLVIGYYFSWDNVSWTFTAKNDSVFALRIGANDSSYVFRVSAVDNHGNGVYDADVYQNGIHYGPEPYTDVNNNKKYDAGEPFTDIGLIDPRPASISLPITNTAPTIAWFAHTTVPDSSLPVMSFRWVVDDLDDESTVDSIRIALNDTTNYVSIPGTIRSVTIFGYDFSSNSPKLKIFTEGNANNVLSVQIPGVKLNDNNIFYAQAVDIASAKSPWIASTSISKSGKWYVKKPQGKILLIDDYVSSDDAAATNFYSSALGSINASFDVYNIRTNDTIPYMNANFLQTLKLYNCVLWYTDYTSPSLDLAQATVNQYLNAHGKIAFSMQFPINTNDADLLGQLVDFLPILKDTSYKKTSISKNTKVASNDASYPDLTVSAQAIYRVRSFNIQPVGATSVYTFPNKELAGSIGFKNSDNSLFFIGLPLHSMNGSNTVPALLTQVFKDFNISIK